MFKSYLELEAIFHLFFFPLPFKGAFAGWILLSRIGNIEINDTHYFNGKQTIIYLRCLCCWIFMSKIGQAGVWRQKKSMKQCIITVMSSRTFSTLGEEPSSALSNTHLQRSLLGGSSLFLVQLFQEILLNVRKGLLKSRGIYASVP